MGLDEYENSGWRYAWGSDFMPGIHPLLQETVKLKVSQEISAIENRTVLYKCVGSLELCFSHLPFALDERPHLQTTIRLQLSHVLWSCQWHHHCRSSFFITILPRIQRHVLKSENTLFWLLVALQFCSYLRTYASYVMHFVCACQSQRKDSVCSRKSCTTVILFHFYQSAISFFGSF